ncbi:sarcosine oxidase subunit gamma [Litorimonas sp. RW-G-Af-16]|uniref:sarcosine oxidase subunit gamma n=1 Tax=Litorimonas sp. RW-G-Af-16 TaxID=3241168 RepID=UPI00390CD70F
MLFDQAIDMPDTLVTPAVSVALLGERGRFNLRIKPSDLAAFKKASALKLPTKINSTTITKDIMCAKLGPDEWVVICDPTSQAALTKKLVKVSQDFVCSVTEISHRNVAFELSGSDATALLNVGCPLDLSLSSLPIGKATRTVFESVSIMVVRTGEDRFHIECWRSFGPYLRDFFNRVLTT